ncbi:MAG: type II restriction endonuclease [Candidatus Omnitrophica bacterium]|nr:type II restriction endonuclease [Candidatus Omnitrophota bacterium]
MANLAVYKKFYNINNTNELLRKFQETLLVSNKTFSYFVDWGKIQANVKKYEYEINILNYLVGIAEPKEKLREILKKNPEVVTVIPLIIAVHDSEITVIEDRAKPAESLRIFDFEAKGKLEDEEITELVTFCDKSGIFNLFSSLKIKNLRDFLLGVETGSDTNARKNRSGTAMEELIEPIIDTIKDITVVKQKKFQYLQEEYKMKIPAKLADRKFDYAIITKRKVYNMEVNYYDGQGSKPQEIVDSYTNRKNELAKDGFGFIWLTDGVGWKGGVHQITNAFNDMDYILNIEFARKGILNEILNH